MRVLRVFFQKIQKISFKILRLGKDIMIRNLLKTFNVRYAVLIYDLITYSPIENIILLLCGKFGIDKAVAVIILAFLL